MVDRYEVQRACCTRMRRDNNPSTKYGAPTGTKYTKEDSVSWTDGYTELMVADSDCCRHLRQAESPRSAHCGIRSHGILAAILIGFRYKLGGYSYITSWIIPRGLYLVDYGVSLLTGAPYCVRKPCASQELLQMRFTGGPLCIPHFILALAFFPWFRSRRSMPLSSATCTVHRTHPSLLLPESSAHQKALVQ
ncbi:hypothetical protein V8C37DRAFT_299525 [Trichoderma ceciliae]